MADSAASIKSIYSGKGDFSDGDFEAISGMSLVVFGQEELINSTNYFPSSSSDFRKFQENFAGLGQGQGPIPGLTDPNSHHYTEEKRGDFSNLKPHNEPGIVPLKVEPRILRPSTPDWYETNISSTNISSASSLSEYHHEEKNGEELEYHGFEYRPGESYSRPLSRNSTTSGFSTTATKDGIEGKRPYRAVPKSLLENLLAGKSPKSQNSQHPLTEQTSTFLQNLPGHGPEPFSQPISPENTRGNTGPKLVVPSLPPITIDEKIDLMEKEKYNKGH